jgi:uncharacterized protein YndB with AHSA1/START domain
MVKPFGKNIVHDTFIAAPPEKVYDAITSAGDWDAFFTKGMELEPHPEGKIVWRWKDWGPRGYTADAPGKVLKAEKPKLFAFEWYPVGPEFPTTVAFGLARKGDGTVIHLEESGYPDTPEGREMILECASGWAEALTLLKFYIEHGITYHSAKTKDM